MNDLPNPGESLMEQTVRYTLELDGELYVVENVPVRVNVEIGEQYFSPETVEHLHAILRGRRSSAYELGNS
jgi:YgiT-type zinc finger domain-containing protein